MSDDESEPARTYKLVMLGDGSAGKVGSRAACEEVPAWGEDG